MIIKALRWLFLSLVAVSLGLLFFDAHWLFPMSVAGAVGVLIVGHYLYRRFYVNKESVEEPTAAPQEAIRQGSVAIDIQGGSGIHIRNNKIRGYGTGIQAVGTEDLQAEGNEIS